MQYKPFPTEKRKYILQKPKEFEQFFQELSLAEQNRLVSRLDSDLPSLGGSFRKNTDKWRKARFQQCWNIAKNPKSRHNALAWNFIEYVWQTWIVSQHDLHILLEYYDNSDDFQGDESKPPNTYFDIECLKYLTYASFNNKINQEIIKKFYEFGYFNKESIVDSYIYLANSRIDIEKNKVVSSVFETIDKMKSDIISLERKNFEIIETYEIIKSKAENFYSVILQQKNDLIKKVEALLPLILSMDDLGKQFIHIEDFTKTIEQERTVHQRNIESISKEYITRFREIQEYIELLGTTVDENSHNIAELHASYHQLATRDIPVSDLAAVTNVPSSLVSNSTHIISAIVSPTTSPIHDCNTFLQNRLLPALAAWMPDITLLWAELFHHAVRACRWVLIPNPAWGLAYHEAMGGTATIQVVQVEPTWLCFADAWKGFVEQCWRAAYQQPANLHLLLFEDVNRALPECWARPWLDLLAGFREVLPVAEQFGWPENLRIIACLAADQAALPLSKTVVQHWAAVVQPQPSEEKSASPLLIPEGHVPLDAWKAWGVHDTAQGVSPVPWLHNGDAEFNMKDFGPLARSVTRDLRCLEASIQLLHPQREAAQTIKNIRIKWPQEYLPRADDTNE